MLACYSHSAVTLLIDLSPKNHIQDSSQALPVFAGQEEERQEGGSVWQHGTLGLGNAIPNKKVFIQWHKMEGDR